MADVLYVQIARDLAARIASGELAVGSVLPKEVDLAVTLGVSRHTLRAAIQELEQLGLVSRRRKLGTRVEAREPSGHYRQALSSLEDLIHYGQAHGRVLQSTRTVVADRALARQIGCAAGSTWLKISFMRLDGAAEPKPIGWTDVYVDAEQGDVSSLPERVAGSPDVLVATLLETHYGRRVAQVRQDVHGALVPAELAEALQAEAGTPALRIVRRYLDEAGRLIDLSITLHPADRYVFSMQLTREQASAAQPAATPEPASSRR
ncbi:GntR family transcriptional regulator [Xylophilus rhododendri]|uniref:GntR family transcriptional regulator n=1 Tax=Xylophilus rhododendri TaxID=2697032 RepID=A0A857JB66_9BURK|nr:GntR family transcriptional regulator [Xylophilus rhododendri]QHJ01265.1 GntR family transcriptional regulator [Xylophilus rhododendri]